MRDIEVIDGELGSVASVAARLGSGVDRCRR
jgi:hypothetical protein